MLILIGFILFQNIKTMSRTQKMIYNSDYIDSKSNKNNVQYKILAI
jgi:hypothetical protein